MVSVRAALSGTMRTLASAGRAQRRVGQRLEAPAVHRVGGIGHQLAQEDLAVGIERVDDEVQQAPDLGAEFMPLHRLAHGVPPTGDV